MSVIVEMLVDKVKLDVIYGDDDLLAREITTSDISRPGFEMTGHLDYCSSERLQLLGMKEWSYFTKMSSYDRHQVLIEMIKPETPAIIVARNLAIPDEMLAIAKEKGIAVLQSHVPTNRLSGEMSWYLDSCLTERTSVHGVLMDIYGMGILIQDGSGIGKSETGLELVKRGHHLVADDCVDVLAKDEETFQGEPAEILHHLLEIRGVGIIDVMSLYGVSVVKDPSQVQLAIYLENFESDRIFDRLGNSNEEIELSGVKILYMRIPVKTGRSVSAVIEAIAMNYRVKQMGFDAIKTFENRPTQLISQNKED